MQLRPHKLLDPLRWKKPARIFVNSMSDLFHRDIPQGPPRLRYGTPWSDGRSWHIYQILTKRPSSGGASHSRELELPLPEHIWIGTSVENQVFADNRIPALLSIEAPVRWLSCEPLLGPLLLAPWLADGGIQWVIDGGESGTGSPACRPRLVPRHPR